MFTFSIMEKRLIDQLKKKAPRRKTSKVMQKLIEGYLDGRFRVEVD